MVPILGSLVSLGVDTHLGIVGRRVGESYDDENFDRQCLRKAALARGYT